MDIEKMIEQLRYLADTPSYTAFHDAKEREIICDQCEADFCYDKQQDAHWCMYEALSRAATALSTLQAENEKLRDENRRWSESTRTLSCAIENLRDELNDLKAQFDMYGGDEGITATFAELEQVKKKNKYSAHDVALILSDAFEDSCACNFNGNYEWLPEKCELLDTCPDVVGVACWEQYLKWRGQKEG